MSARLQPLLASSLSLYLHRGFSLTGEEPQHSFGVDLVSQCYEFAF